jgi:hypothetical protein
MMVKKAKWLPKWSLKPIFGHISASELDTIMVLVLKRWFSKPRNSFIAIFNP